MQQRPAAAKTAAVVVAGRWQQPMKIKNKL